MPWKSDCAWQLHGLVGLSQCLLWLELKFAELDHVLIEVQMRLLRKSVRAAHRS
jgi:hypothetical protein